MQTQDGTDIVVALLVLTDNLLVIGIDEDGKNRAFNAEGRFDDKGNIMLVLLLIIIGQILTGGLLMAGQIISLDRKSVV